MDLEQLGSGGPNPCGDSVKKMSTHCLSLVNGWIWSNWGLGAQIHVETVLRKRALICERLETLTAKVCNAR